MDKIDKKRGKIKPRVALFLKNLANGMVQNEAYLAAGFQAKSIEVANSAASRLLRWVHETMTDREMIDIMVPTSTLAGTVAEIMQSSPVDDTRLRAASLAGKWKGLEDQATGPAQGAVIVIMQSNKTAEPQVIDITPQNITPLGPKKPKSIVD